MDAGKEQRIDRLKELLAPIRAAERADRPSVAEHHCLALLEEFPNHAGTWDALASAHMNQARFDEAELALVKAMEHVPDRLAYIVHNKRGHLALLRADRAGAIAHYERARSLAPTSVTPLIFIGCVHQEAGDVTLSERFFREALTIDESDEAYFNLARALVSQRRLDEAREAVERAVAIDPQSAPARALLEELDELERL